MPGHEIATQSLCEPAQSKCNWTCHKTDLTREFTEKMTGPKIAMVLRFLVMVNVYMYISYEWLLPYGSRERLHNKWLTMGKTLRMIAVHSYSCKQASRIYDLNTTMFCHLSTLVITRFFRHDSLIALAPLTIGTIRKPECWWSGGAGHGKNIVGGFLRRAARIHCRAMKWFTQRFWGPIIGVLPWASDIDYNQYLKTNIDF